jgi:hypothetical protein
MTRVARGAQVDAAGARRLLQGLTTEGAALREAKGCYVLVSPSVPPHQEIRVAKAWSIFACARIGLNAAAKILLSRKRDGPCCAGRKLAMTPFASSIS